MTVFNNVNTEAELRTAIFQISNDFATDGAVSTNYTIKITGDITLSKSLPMIRGDGVHTITINGNGHTIDAQHNGRVFFVESGTLAINDITIDNALAKGGDGGDAPFGAGGGGGGGLGAGAAVFVNKGAVVTLTDVNVGDAAAVGGAGGHGGDGTSVDNGGGGGGGLGADGGQAGIEGGGGGGGYAGIGGDATAGGGGGGGGEFGSGGQTDGGGGGGGGQQGNGNGGFLGGGGGGGAALGADGGYGAGATGGTGGGNPQQGGNGGDAGASGQNAVAVLGGGGGGGLNGAGGNGRASGGGGGTGNAATEGPGGRGGLGGGGGGGSGADGGAGGKFGGGGGTGDAGAVKGGDGGFGGGGGGANTEASEGQTGGAGGFGSGGGGATTGGAGGKFGGHGGSGTGADGGGGAALGGAIFVRKGGTLILNDGGFTGTYGVTGGTTGGTGGATDGKAHGKVLFLQGHGAATTLAISDGNAQTIGGNNAIAGRGILAKDGDGALVIAGSNGKFHGAVTVADGLLAVDGSIGKAATTVETGGTLGGTGKVGVTQVDSGGALSPGASAGVLHTGDLTFGAAARFMAEIGGNTTGPGGYDRVAVKGTVHLGGAILDASLIGGFKPSAGDHFKIVANNGHDAVHGTFKGLAEGAHFLIDRHAFTITYHGGSHHNDVVLTATTAVIVGTGGADLVNASHTVAGQPLPTDGADLIKGKGGADNLSGLAGDDTILGGKGSDGLYGNQGDDHLRGGAGADLLNGGKGTNHLTGGKGADAFLFSTKLGPANVGTITDFGRGNDHVDLALSVFPGIGPKGELAADLFAIDIFDSGVHFLKPDALIVYNPVSGELSYDKNGNDPGGLVRFAEVTPGTHLDHTDFFVV